MHPILERFQRDVASHQMEVLHDDGLYRHLRFSRDGSSAYHFNITTWPGYLAITGDMGDFVFSRVQDMFAFFRDEPGRLGINPGYWAEKIQAGASTPDRSLYMDWDEKAFKQRVVEEYKRWLESNGPLDPEVSSDLKDQIREEILDEAHSEELACVAVANFHSDDAPDLFDDFLMELGSSCHEYSFHYLWCCWAIVWGVSRYDEQREAAAA
ncbi:hypothetical protein [Modicisalibacter coralii]|uniref:hypothetical protein n=1 Tax=Modicisalibacter coralii TaxID=2304602 RepID=UPI00100A88BF|nr:hypothetical protein [Halomonas coralii]